MRWIAAGIAVVVLTIAVAGWVGRPSPLTIEIPDFSGVEDLSVERIHGHLDRLASGASRMSGYDAAGQAFSYIRERLDALGVTAMEVQEFDVAAPIVESAAVDVHTPGGDVTIPLHPVWPNLVRTSQTGPEGLSGPLVDVGRGREVDLNGKDLRGAIVVMDWASDAEWLSVLEFGGKAVLFRANELASGYQARKKFLTVSTNIPRFFVTADGLPMLDAALAAPEPRATVHCAMDWQSVPARNLLARITERPNASTAAGHDATPIVFHAYYDAISVVPTLAPGAEQACGAATLLELAHYLTSLPEAPPRPIYVLFTGGHGQAMSGMAHFVRELHDGLAEGWRDAPPDSLLREMGPPGLMIGLDLSTRADQLGLFCLGRFRQQSEGWLRPKFSTLGLKMDAFAKQFMDSPTRSIDNNPAPFVDCINLTHGRGWWTFFPYPAAFASEIPTLAGFPAVTLSTINDDRRYVDTPEDILPRLNLDLFARQLLYVPGERVGLARLALAFAYWKGPFVSSPLESKLAKIAGRAVWLHQKEDYTPNRPLAGAAVALKTYRNDKTIVGFRGVPVALADEKGRFEFDGLIDTTGNALFANVELEAYGLASEHFLDANPEAAQAYLDVLRRGGMGRDAIESDGSIIYAVDWARPGEYPVVASLINEVQHLNLVTFPCKPITLFGLTEPRGFVSLTDFQLLDAATESPPFQWGGSYSDSGVGDPEENCISVWADPTLRVRLTLGFGIGDKRLILINNSPEDPVGKGYVLSELETIPSWALQGARNMWWLNQHRIKQFENYGIANPRVASTHQEAGEHLDKAEAALDGNDYLEYRIESEKGWALESKAYNELRDMANNMIRGVLFYLLLLLPFAYCLERLVVNAATIRNRVIGMVVIFVASFVVLALIHPAFRFTMTPMLVLVAFVILALAASVSLLILGKFDRMLRERKQALTGVREDTVALGDVAVRAVDLGVANIRRRPQRAFLTGLTIILVTFTLLSSISVVPEVSISRLRHLEGEPVYNGLLTRDRGWAPMPFPFYDSVKRSLGYAEGEGESRQPRNTIVAGRAWFFSDYSGNHSRIDLAPVASQDSTGGQFTTMALMGMEPTEPDVTAVEDTLIAGRWFQNEDEVGIILPEHVAENLGFSSDDLGKKVLVFGEELPVIGVFDSTEFDELRDIDGEPLTPVNFVQQRNMDAQMTVEEQIDTLKEYVHWPSDQIVIVPFKFARTLNGTVRSVAVRTGEEVSAITLAESYARRSNMAILASDGEQVTLFASLSRSRMSAAGQIAIPLFLGFIMVLGTMLGSVYERRREIFVYNSVGLSPTNVASLFLAESSVYAIIGAAAGYLLGQGVTKLLSVTGMLSGLTLNYSAGSTVFVTVLTMFIVLLSTLYPARQAFLAAVPKQRRRIEGIEEDSASGGDTVGLYLPFVASPSSIFAMQAYMYDFLDSIQGVSIGRLAVDDLQAGCGSVADHPAPVLRFRAWLAPFDLGISHNAELSVVFREERNVYQYHLTATRESGDQQNWRRLTPWFILALRKQLLMWRILTPEEQEVCMEKAEKLFGHRKA